MQRTESIALHERGGLVIPGSVHTCRRKTNPPLCVDYGDGGYIMDVDGNRYLDLHASYGAILLGHGNPRVTQAVIAQAPKGVLYGIGVTRAEVKLAERIATHVPSIERVLFCNSGTEATLHAMRLARAVTGRTKILKFQECYHGTHDYALPPSTGIPDATRQQIVQVPYNDLDAVRAAFAEHDGEIAAVIVEPVAHNKETILPNPGFLEGLRGLTTLDGALLIMDEVITWGRHSINGYQGMCGVIPDLTTLAKALGNGYHVAAIGGRAALMEQFSTTLNGAVHYGGTYSGGLDGVEAANAVFDVLETEPVTPHLFMLGDHMRTGLDRIVANLGINATVTGLGGIYGVTWSQSVPETEDDAATAYRRLLLPMGVLEMPEARARNTLMYAHTLDDVAMALEASEKAMTAVAKRLA